MQPETLSSRLSAIIDRHTDKFQDEVLKSQRNLYNSIAGYLAQLELRQWNIVTSTKNLKLITKIDKVLLDSVLTKTYNQRLKSYTDGFNESKKEIDAYFVQLVGEAFEPNIAYKVLLEESIDSALVALGRGGLSANVVQSAKKIIQQNVTVGGSFADMMETLRQDILGGQVQGTLERHVRQITNDALSVFNRTYLQAVTNDLELNKYKYSGSTIRDTREFCVQRSNKVYTEQEVKSWASISWQGKMRGTNQTTIFQYCGGYNCRHILIPTL